MKKLLIILLVLSVWATVGFGENLNDEEKDKPELYCPATKMSDNDKCMGCHVIPDFSVKEKKPDANLNLPYDTRLSGGKLHFIVKSIDSDYVQKFLDYVYWHPEFRHKIVMEIHSPGGSLLDAWKIVGLMDQAKNRGIIIETRCYGFAASAGFLIFVNGTLGERNVNKMAEFMWHELWSIAFLKLDTPSKKEDEAKVFRHLQDTIHNWLITRCKKTITKEEVDEWVRHKDKWLNGADMIEMGFADDVIR